jgi:hypothetical protein
MTNVIISLDEILDHLFDIEDISCEGVELLEHTEINVDITGKTGNPAISITFQNFYDNAPDWDLEFDDCINLSDIPSVYIPSEALLKEGLTEDDIEVKDMLDNILFIFGRIVVKIGRLEIQRAEKHKVAITLSVGKYSSTLEVDINDSKGHLKFTG